jgi:hypothetical protein
MIVALSAGGLLDGKLGGLGALKNSIDVDGSTITSSSPQV